MVFPLYFLINYYFLQISVTDEFQKSKSNIDVIHYHTILEPDLRLQTINGEENIVFLAEAFENEITFNKGQLEIGEVTGKDVQDFLQKDQLLTIRIKPEKRRQVEVKIKYKGKPNRGIQFDPQNQTAYTVFSTSQWMVCKDDPDDRATFKLDLIIPKDRQCVASGILIGESENENKRTYSWDQRFESPTYTYGFAIDQFNSFKEVYKGIELNYFARNYSKQEMKIIFSNTSDMIDFFQDKSGVEMVQPIYNQVLIGDHYQEMSGFSVLKENYGKLVLADSTETNLISHELAHQWWGNMITCKSWEHFWLNEGLATFLSAAYNEYRFGKEKYNLDIQSYLKVYEAVKSRGNDKSLVFENWNSPTRDDRSLVYYKGAYVFHLLKELLGDQLFWDGIRLYSHRNFNKSVETADLKQAMEEASGKDLSNFFDKWVYNSL